MADHTAWMAKTGTTYTTCLMNPQGLCFITKHVIKNDSSICTVFIVIKNLKYKRKNVEQNTLFPHSLVKHAILHHWKINPSLKKKRFKDQKKQQKVKSVLGK